jgi:hypothetical protein
MSETSTVPDPPAGTCAAASGATASKLNKKAAVFMIPDYKFALTRKALSAPDADCSPGSAQRTLAAIASWMALIAVDAVVHVPADAGVPRVRGAGCVATGALKD